MRSRRSGSTYWRTFVLLLTVFYLCVVDTKAQQPAILIFDQTIDVPISCLPKNETIKHTYEIEVAKGEYTEILCQQVGVDIRMVITDLEGRKIAEIDSYSGAYGPECWRGFSTSQSKYILRIEILSTRGEESKYILSLPVKRSASVSDRRRAQAQELYSRAWRFKNGTQRDMDEAYYLYEQAAIIYREVGDGLGEAQTVASTAALGCPTLTKRLKTDLQRQSLDLHRRLHERNGEAIALHSLGEVYAEDGRHSLAISSYKQALQVYRDIGDWQGEVIALNSLAMVYCQVEQLQDALSYLKQALKASQKACDHSKEALVMKHIGELYEGMGQVTQAAEYYRQADALKE